MQPDDIGDTRPGFCPPLEHTTIGTLSIWGLLVNAAYPLLTAVGAALVMALIGLTIGSSWLCYSTSQADKMLIVI
ncbi:MAG: hypothetical protein ACJAZO_003078 [Myxococcota bacterium]